MRNPATGELLGTVPDMGTSETRAAIEAAAAALPAWGRRTAKERGAILRRWFDLIVANQDDLATLMTAEQGKPLAESRGEISYAASFIEWFAEEGKRVYGDVIPAFAADRRNLVLRQAGGRGGRDHPLEFPVSDDHAQVRPRSRRRVHFLVKRPYKLLTRRSRWRNSARGPDCPPACSTS